jgi:hypothetical protein
MDKPAPASGVTYVGPSLTQSLVRLIAGLAKTR